MAGTFGRLSAGASPEQHAFMRRRLARACAHVAIVLAILAVLGATVSASAEHAARAAYPAPGQLVDIGEGQLVHLRMWGEPAAGRPTILLDASAGLPSSAWAWVGRLLGARGLVVAYDRPGLAWSTGPPRPRDALAAATALSRALNLAGIPGPYVVVGHSFGGLSARAFAATHRREVVGLVLLDATHPEGGGGAGFALAYRLTAWQARLGYYQLFGIPNDMGGLPEEERAAASSVSKWPSFLETTAAELEAWEASAAQLRGFGDLDNLPLLVVCAAGSESHLALQRDLTRLSTRATFVQLNVSHTGMLLNHAEAQLTTGAIEGFLGSLSGTIPR